MASRKPPENPEAEAAEVPSINPPPGVRARVKTTIDYERQVDPDNPPGDSRDLLSELAASEADNLEALDPLAAFLQEWFNFAGYNCEIVRLPDPAARRMPGNNYARPCFELERLGGIPFDPANFIPTLQMVNGYSGGAFRVWLTDANGQPIPEARLDRLVVADPPYSSAGARSNREGLGINQPGHNYAPAPLPSKPAEPSEFEKQMQELQKRLLQNALDRVMTPPPPAPPASTLTSEQQLAMAVFSQGDLLRNVIEKVANAVQSPESVTPATWKDKAMDYVIQNPVVGQQIANVGERLLFAITNLIPGLNAPPQPQPPHPTQPPIQHAPQATPAAQAAASNMPPEVPTDELLDAEDEEDEDMAILDEMLALLNDTRPIVANDPVFIELHKAHPAKFAFYVRMIALAPSVDNIIDAISKASPLYASLLSSPVTGPHLRQRLEELQMLCRQPTQPQATAAPAPPAPPAAPIDNTPES